MSEALHITTEVDGERIDAFLARKFPEKSRSYWQKLCKEGFVMLEGKALKPSDTLSIESEVTLLLPNQPDFNQQTLPILYEDDDVLVINKPSGMLTHSKGAINEEFTVADFVRSRTTDSADTNRPGIVHRLDRATSGVLIAAKHSEAKRWLQKQFSERKVKKHYIALVEGRLEKPSIMLELPLERNPRKPQLFKVSANGKLAQTAIQVNHIFKNYTLLDLHPLTGRTHQLRVHTAYLGHTIVGDELYGKPNKALGRLFLHAAELELTLPSRERKTFQAALPTELKKFIDDLA